MGGKGREEKRKGICIFCIIVTTLAYGYKMSINLLTYLLKGSEGSPTFMTKFTPLMLARAESDRPVSEELQ